MSKNYGFVLLFFIMNAFLSFAQSAESRNLENKISAFNDALQYEKSIKILTEVINNKEATAYEKYYAYLLKSYTYKRLFNYSQTLYNLDLALGEGLQSDNKEEVRNTIEAEKCFVYFDTEDYKKAAIFIDHLRMLQFKHLSVSTKSWIIMQDGYIKMLNKDYSKSEQLLDEAIKIVAAHSPENLPNIYGKKIILYNQMKLFDKRDAAFKEGLAISKKYKKIKYEMYLYEIMRNLLQDNQDYKTAFSVQKKYDSISKYYDAINSNSNLELIEKKLAVENTKLKEQNAQYVYYILFGCIIFLISTLVFVVKLYQSNKAKRILVENENERIYTKIEDLTKELTEKGKKTADYLSDYDLSERQIEIINFIKEGKSNKEIADQLHVSENTIKYHLKIIYTTLSIERRSAIKQSL